MPGFFFFHTRPCLLNPCVTSLATGTKSGRHPAKIRIRLAPHPIFWVASTHNIPPSIFKLSSEALQTSTLPNSDPDNPPSESCFWGGITNPCSVWVGRGLRLAGMQLVGFLPAVKNKTAVSSIQSLGAGAASAERLSVCGMQWPFHSKLLSSRSHLQPGPAEVTPRLGAFWAPRRFTASCRDSAQRTAAVEISSQFCQEFLPHLIFFFFCLCDAVPSVFFEGYTISGFKSA